VAGSDFLVLDPGAEPGQLRTDWLTDAVRAAIGAGRLQVGDRLPPTRDLAGDLGLSRGVVVEAYRRLADEGLLTARTGAGTRVQASGSRRPALAPAEPSPPEPRYDLSPGVPDLSAFPRGAWLRAERAVLSSLSDRDLRYGDPRGTTALREALAARLARTRGVRAGPADVLVLNGVAQGLSLLGRVLPEAGLPVMAVEDPGSYGARATLEFAGLTTIGVPVDHAGLDVDRLTATGSGAVLVTPAHQWPTGVVLAPERRRALLAWAADGGLVVEDDYDAEHRYDRAPVPSLQALASDQVVHLGSVSKSLAPALRLGWVVAPRPLHQALVEAKRHADITSPALPQLVLARLMTSGDLDRHLRGVRVRHRRRRDAMLSALTQHLPDLQVHGVAAGLHLLVTGPSLADDQAVEALALRHGVQVQALSRHRQRTGPGGLVLGYAACPPDRLHDAVRALATAISETHPGGAARGT
jgi:GntR family transcriptional regulator/MocR family aminotransferase